MEQQEEQEQEERQVLVLPIESEPGGAEVYVDDRLSCPETPCTVTFEGAGPFVIRLRKKYCKDSVLPVRSLEQLRDRGKLEVQLELEQQVDEI